MTDLRDLPSVGKHFTKKSKKRSALEVSSSTAGSGNSSDDNDDDESSNLSSKDDSLNSTCASYGKISASESATTAESAATGDTLEPVLEDRAKEARSLAVRPSATGASLALGQALANGRQDR